MSTGLAIYELQRSLYIFKISSSSVEVVSTITGRLHSASSATISASTSCPFMRGMFRSSRIKSGRGAPACAPCLRRKSMHSTPSFAWCRLRSSLDFLNPMRVSSTSFSLSSTSRISAALVLVSLLIICLVRPLRLARTFCRVRRNAETKIAPVSGLGLHPNGAAMAFHHPAAHGQPYARTRILLLIVQPFEDFEDAPEILRIDANPIVANGNGPIILLWARLGGHMDMRRFGPVIFESIANQVLHQLR